MQVGLIENPSQENAVLTALHKLGAMTRHQIAYALGIPEQSVCARVGTLMGKGMVVECDGAVMGPYGKLNGLVRAVGAGEKLESPQTDLFA